jgi:hypothetical protein
MNKVIVFDIDGTLTDDDVFKAYQELRRQPKITTGIVTRRTPTLSDQFIHENDIDPEFVENRVIKSFAFNRIKSNIGGEQYIYVGNRVTDYMYSRLSGWDFVLAQTVESIEDILG